MGKHKLQETAIMTIMKIMKMLIVPDSSKSAKSIFFWLHLQISQLHQFNILAKASRAFR